MIYLQLSVPILILIQVLLAERANRKQRNLDKAMVERIQVLEDVVFALLVASDRPDADKLVKRLLDGSDKT